MIIKRGSFDNPDDNRLFRHYNFPDVEVDPVIPVVLVFATTCAPHPRIKENVRRVLFLKRGFEVGAMRGKWSPIAGVDDHVDDQGNFGIKETIASASNELWGEAGLKSDSLSWFDDNRYSDPKLQGRIWDQKLIHAEVDQLEVTLNWENYGYAWIPVPAISHYVDTGDISDPYLEAFVREGNIVEEQGNLSRFAHFCRTSGWV